MRKRLETREVPLAILSRILAQSCVTPLSDHELCSEGLRMIVLVSLIVLLRELLVSTINIFSLGASLHRHSLE